MKYGVAGQQAWPVILYVHPQVLVTPFSQPVSLTHSLTPSLSLAGDPVAADCVHVTQGTSHLVVTHEYYGFTAVTSRTLAVLSRAVGAFVLP